MMEEEEGFASLLEKYRLVVSTAKVQLEPERPVHHCATNPSFFTHPSA